MLSIYRDLDIQIDEALTNEKNKTRSNLENNHQLILFNVKTD